MTYLHSWFSCRHLAPHAFCNLIAAGGGWHRYSTTYSFPMSLIISLPLAPLLIYFPPLAGKGRQSHHFFKTLLQPRNLHLVNFLNYRSPCLVHHNWHSGQSKDISITGFLWGSGCVENLKGRSTICLPLWVLLLGSQQIGVTSMLPADTSELSRGIILDIRMQLAVSFTCSMVQTLGRTISVAVCFFSLLLGSFVAFLPFPSCTEFLSLTMI